MSDVLKDLMKKYGKESFMSGDEIVQKDNDIIPFSPNLDVILGGGIPSGSVVTLSGDPKCGKTVSALHFAGKAQQMGKSVHYLSVEGRLKKRDLEGIACLNLKDLNVVESTKGNIFTAEKWLSIAEDIIHKDPGSVIILDSASQLITEKEMSSDIGDAHRAPGAVLLSRFTRRVSNVLPTNDVTLVIIIHLIANTSGFGKSKVKSGGRKISYAADVDLEAIKVKFWKPDGDASEPIGQEVTWKTNWTAITAPGKKVSSWIKYGVGIDETQELLELAQETGFLIKSGSWFHLKMSEDQEVLKFHGLGKAYTYFKQNDELLQELKKNIYGMIA